MTEPHTNWAGNLTYGARAIHHPETEDQVREIVAMSSRARALGARHSFSAVADTGGDHIALDRFAGVVGLDRARRTVTVEAGITYAALAGELERRGFALANMASLPHITVAGACATATHGSGERNGNLATVVSALRMVTAGGDILALSRDADGEAFQGAVVGLGALGVVTQLTLDVEPSYLMRQTVWQGLPLAELARSFDAIEASAYSVSLFTDWRGGEINQVWLKARSAGEGLPDAQANFFGARPAVAPIHPIGALSAESCTEQLGVPGPWHERLPHFRIDHTPSSGDELQSEYFVPREHAVAALHAVHGLRARIAPRLQISEIRTVAADSLWLSPCYLRDSVAIHFTWKNDWAAVRALLPAIESALARFQPRPHWGKLFTLSASAVQAQYARLQDFRALMRTHDPAGKFGNAFVDAFVRQRAVG